MTDSSSETSLSVLTPAGRSAIASLGLHGPNAWSVLRNLWRTLRGSGSNLPERPAVGQVFLGRMGDEAHDEVVLVVKATNPVFSAELYCHGGTQTVALLLEALARAGVRGCSWIDHEPDDASDRSAAAALIAAPTVRTAGILLDQYHGAFLQRIQAIVQAWHRSDHSSVQYLLGDLVQYSGIGRHLISPWRVVVAGAANAGKSSLINAITGYQRCIVSPVPGTTRDLVAATVALEGWPIELVDTAGMRISTEPIEKRGVELAEQAGRVADLCVWVIDSASAEWQRAPELPSLMLVLNKTDLRPAPGIDSLVGAIRVSALTGDGILRLCEHIVKALAPVPPPPGAPVPYSPKLCFAVEAAWHHYAQEDRNGCWAQLEEINRILRATMREAGAS